MNYSQTIELDLTYQEALPKVKDAFKEQGFGTLTEIDVRATLKEKIGRDIEPYMILGTCNPDLASKALDVEREIGLLLPCNVVVTERHGKTLVQAFDPQVMVAILERDELKPIADEAAERIRRALAELASS
ncbi:MAG: DUF302 domain-containing protein [Actinobacteria bacterium]|nr:DUF302 domain-containing protein [Actinomycetota bacterium]